MRHMLKDMRHMMKNLRHMLKDMRHMMKNMRHMEGLTYMSSLMGEYRCQIE